MKVDYDKISDVLYVTIKENRHAVVENGDIFGGVLILRDLDTHEIVGLTIDGFTQRIKQGYLDNMINTISKYFKLCIREE